jgi:hypothetical protein
MERKTRNIRTLIGRVVLRKSDIRTIAEMLNEGGVVTSIETDEHKTSSLDEFMGTVGSFKELSIYRLAANPQRMSSVTLDADRAWVTMDSPDNADLGVATKICDLLRARRAWRVGPYVPLTIASLAIPILSASLIVGTFASNWRAAFVFTVGVAAVTFVMGCLLGLVRWAQGDVVKFRPEPGSVPPVDKRGIASKAIWLVIGMVISQVGNVIAKRFEPEKAPCPPVSSPAPH